MKEKSFFYGIIALVVMLALSVFTSCDSDMEDFSLNVNLTKAAETTLK